MSSFLVQVSMLIVSGIRIKDYIEKHLKVDTKKEKKYFDEFHKEDLEEILEQQYKISQYQKDHNFKSLFSTLIIVDDFCDDVRFSKHNGMLNALYIRGRHFGVNVISSTQKFNALSTIIRVNFKTTIFFQDEKLQRNTDDGWGTVRLVVEKEFYQRW